MLQCNLSAYGVNELVEENVCKVRKLSLTKLFFIFKKVISRDQTVGPLKMFLSFGGFLNFHKRRHI